MFHVSFHIPDRLRSYKCQCAFACLLALALILSFCYTALPPLRLINGLYQPARSCGSSSAEAIEHGCQFDPTSFSWLHRDCYDTDLVEQFLSYEFWEWFEDEDATVPIERQDVLEGKHKYLYVSWKYHLTHCTFMWKKLHRALLRRGAIDNYIGDLGHTEHCSRMLLTDGMNRTSTNTIIRRKFTTCDPQRTLY